MHYYSVPGHKIVVRRLLRSAQQATQGAQHACGTCCAPQAPQARKPPAGSPGRPPEPPEAKKWRYMREYMPENQVQSAFKRLPNLEKACIRMPWDVLEKKRAVIYLVIYCSVCYGTTLRGASQNDIDDDGE